MKKHFTTTVYIISKVDNQIKVLLHQHKKLKLWLGMGGHIEDNENPVEGVLREAIEEAGVKVELIQKAPFSKTKNGTMLPTPFALFEPYIPPYKGQRAHYHIDLVYFGTIRNPQKVKMEDGAEHQWFNINDLKNINAPAEVIYYCKEAIKAGKKILKG